MAATSLKINLTLLPLFLDDRKGRLIRVTKFLELGSLSLCHAAQLAGSARSAFINLMAFYDNPVANYSAKELAAKTSS